MIELAYIAGGLFAGFVLGYVVCAIYLGARIEELQDDIATFTDRDERGRFKKSMRKLKYD
jgi:cytochrome bd-type quinol oxidase subunit 2